MSEHIAVGMLGKYFSTPERVENQLREVIEEHLASCGFCSEVAARMRFFSQEHVLPEDDQVHDFAKDLIQRLPHSVSSRIVVLHPVVIAAFSDVARVTKLAAASASSARYIGMMTWASEDGSLVLHVSKDQRLNRFIARIFTDEEADLSGIWMRFDEDPDIVLTDAQGVVLLPGDIGHIRLLQPTLVFPFLRLALDDADWNRLRASGCLDLEVPDRKMRLSLQHDGQVLKVIVSECAAEVHAIAVLGEENCVSRMSGRYASFPIQRLQYPLTFALYHFANDVAEK